MDNNLEKLALDILQKVADIDGLDEDRDLDLYEAGLLDSLSVISIIILVEEKLGIRLQPTDLTRDNISSVTNFYSFLEKYIKTGNN